MPVIITAKRRASATIASSSRVLAIFIAQALSQDHFGQTQQHDMSRS